MQRPIPFLFAFPRIPPAHAVLRTVCEPCRLQRLCQLGHGGAVAAVRLLLQVLQDVDGPQEILLARGHRLVEAGQYRLQTRHGEERLVVHLQGGLQESEGTRPKLLSIVKYGGMRINILCHYTEKYNLCCIFASKTNTHHEKESYF